MSNKIVRVVFDADLRCSHDGLSQMLEKNFQIKTDNLKLGEFVVCLNSAETIVKIYTHGNTIAHYKSKKGRIELKAIMHLPKFFNGSSFAYNKALAETLKK